MGAAMQSGIGGHAGLFSNANDIAKMMQMYLQKATMGIISSLNLVHLTILINVIIVKMKIAEV